MRERERVRDWESEMEIKGNQWTLEKCLQNPQWFIFNTLLFVYQIKR